MSILKSIAGGMMARRAGARLGRVIPNPFMRYAVMVAATSLAPRVYRGVRSRLQARKADRLAAGRSGLPIGAGDVATPYAGPSSAFHPELRSHAVTPGPMGMAAQPY